MPSTQYTEFEQDEQGRWFMPKDPGATLEYALDWRKWLGGDTLTGVTVALGSGSELTKLGDRIAGTKTIVKVSGGTTLNSMQSIKFTVTTANGRTDVRTVYLKIAGRP